MMILFLGILKWITLTPLNAWSADTPTCEPSAQELGRPAPEVMNEKLNSIAFRYYDSRNDNEKKGQITDPFWSSFYRKTNSESFQAELLQITTAGTFSSFLNYYQDDWKCQKAPRSKCEGPALDLIKKGNEAVSQLSAQCLKVTPEALSQAGIPNPSWMLILNEKDKNKPTHLIHSRIICSEVANMMGSLSSDEFQKLQQLFGSSFSLAERPKSCTGDRIQIDSVSEVKYDPKRNKFEITEVSVAYQKISPDGKHVEREAKTIKELSQKVCQ